MYSKKAMDYFMHPRNMGEIKNPDGMGKAGNIVCGDIMWIYIKVGSNNEGKAVLKDIKFKTLGCAAAIATSSMITELALDKTLEEALEISKQDVADALDGLPPVKLHCSVLAADALSEAIYDYYSRNDISIPDDLAVTHERVQKDLHTTEETHGEYVKSQEEH